MHKLLGLDKALRGIKGSLKVEIVKKVELEEQIEQEKLKLVSIRDNPEYDDGIREDIRSRITRLNDDLKTRQENINLLNSRLSNQITGIRETITKVLDKDISLAKKIWTLFREQSITITSVLMSTGMAIRALVKALLPSGGGVWQWEVSLHLRMKKV